MRSTDLNQLILPRYHETKGGDCVVEASIIGKVIASFREERGLSQEVLSGLARLDRTHYSKIERGLRSPTLDTLFKIAHAMEISPHEIIIALEEAIRENSQQ